ncbi:MAG: ABC transporter substrate-binding protein [bacterium]|nr:ABC transporter substrate-binding protein [bacterium]
MKKKVWLFAAILALFALIASSCGNDDDTSESSSPTTEATQGAATIDPPQESQAEPPDEAEAPDPGTDPPDANQPENDASQQAGGTLTFGAASPLTNLDPDLTTGPDAEWLFPTYDRLIHLAPNGDYIPGLAESWSLSDDSLTLSLRLRSDVVFHDGSPFNADVAVTNLDRSRTLEGSPSVSTLSVVQSVEAVDETTVNLNLAEPAASLLGTLSDRPGIMISGQALADGVDLSAEAVGAGMYTLESWQPGDRAIYKRFEDYWDPQSALLDELVLVDLSDSTARLGALRDGQLDAARIDATDVDTVEGEGLEVVSGPTLEVFHLSFNLAEGTPWTNPLVRQAMSHALDKEGILEAIYGGAGSVVSQMFPPQYFAYNPDIPANSRPFNIARAQELMDESGVEPFTIRVGQVISSQNTAIPLAIQQAWAEIGITVEIVPVVAAEFVEKWFAQDFDMLYGFWSGRPDPNNTNDLIYSAGSTFINAAGYDVPEVNELLAASEQVTGAERTDLLHDLNAAVDEVQFNIPVLARDYILAKYPRVNGLEPWVSVKMEFRGVSIDG